MIRNSQDNIQVQLFFIDQRSQVRTKVRILQWVGPMIHVFLGWKQLNNAKSKSTVSDVHQLHATPLHHFTT